MRALERHRRAHGEYPETLAALVPQFMSKLPSDLMTGKALKYQRTDGGKFRLYSVGWNLKDDGGTRNSERTAGDWVLASSKIIAVCIVHRAPLLARRAFVR